MEEQIKDPVANAPTRLAFTQRMETDPVDGSQRLRITGVLRPLALDELSAAFRRMESKQCPVLEIRATRTGIGRVALGHDWISKEHPAIWGARIIWDKGVLDHDILLMSRQSADLA